jgi:hypothetical protein
MEKKLERLGVPHLSVESTRQSAGYRVEVPARDRAERVRARNAMKSAGYRFGETDHGLEAYFFLEEAAQKALDMLSRKGLRGVYGRTQGPTPFWIVYAGPFFENEARTAQDRLGRAGLKTLLKKRP